MPRREARERQSPPVTPGKLLWPDPRTRLRFGRPSWDRLSPGYGLASRAHALLKQQKGGWELLRNGYDSLRSVRSKVFEFDGFQVKVQFNPGRLISTMARVDAVSVRERKCLLCPENLPADQRAIRCEERIPAALQSVSHLPGALHNPYTTSYAAACSRVVRHVPGVHP